MGEWGNWGNELFERESRARAGPEKLGLDWPGTALGPDIRSRCIYLAEVDGKMGNGGRGIYYLL